MWVSLNSHYSCMGASSATSSGLNETHVGGIILTLFMLSMGTSLTTSSGLSDTCGWHYTHIVHVEDWDEFCHLVRTDETHVGGIILTLFMLRIGTSSATSSGLMIRMWVALYSHYSCCVWGRVQPPRLDC